MWCVCRYTFAYTFLYQMTMFVAYSSFVFPFIKEKLCICKAGVHVTICKRAHGFTYEGFFGLCHLAVTFLYYQRTNRQTCVRIYPVSLCGIGLSGGLCVNLVDTPPLYRNRYSCTFLRFSKKVPSLSLLSH